MSKIYDQYKDFGKNNKDAKGGFGTAKNGGGNKARPPDKSDSVVYKKISMLKNEIEEIKNIEGALTMENEENKAQLSNVKKIIDGYCEKINGLNKENKVLREYKDKYSALENQRGTTKQSEVELKKKIASLEEENKKKTEAIESLRGTTKQSEVELKKKIASLEEEIKKKNEAIEPPREMKKPPRSQAVNDPAEERLMIVWLRSSLESEQKTSAVLKEKIKKLEIEIESLRGKKR